MRFTNSGLTTAAVLALVSGAAVTEVPSRFGPRDATPGRASLSLSPSLEQTAQQSGWHGSLKSTIRLKARTSHLGPRDVSTTPGRTGPSVQQASQHGSYTPNVRIKDVTSNLGPHDSSATLGHHASPSAQQADKHGSSTPKAKLKGPSHLGPPHRCATPGQKAGRHGLSPRKVPLKAGNPKNAACSCALPGRGRPSAQEKGSHVSSKPKAKIVARTAGEKLDYCIRQIEHAAEGARDFFCCTCCERYDEFGYPLPTFWDKFKEFCCPLKGRFGVYYRDDPEWQQEYIEANTAPNVARQFWPEGHPNHIPEFSELHQYQLYDEGEPYPDPMLTEAYDPEFDGNPRYHIFSQGNGMLVGPYGITYPGGQPHHESTYEPHWTEQHIGRVL